MNECSSIRVVLRRPAVTKEKIELYGKYLSSKHGTAEKDPDGLADMLAAMHYGYDSIIEMNYYEADRLIAVGIVDAGTDCLSANYFYYDTGRLEIRPGIFSILEEISLAGRMGKKYYYLGFLVEENPKMSYKKFFRPNQVYRDGRWTAFR